MLESRGHIEPKLFEDDPHVIPVPPNPEMGEPVFRVIVDKGNPEPVGNGTHRSSIGVVMTNFTKRTCYVTAQMKDGYLIISAIRRDEG